MSDAPRAADGANVRGAPPRCVALIPARAGSKRVRNKNTRTLGGHPLLAYTIAAARASGVFERIVVSTDAEEIAAIARHYGADVPFLRPPELATDRSPDIDWVEHALRTFFGAQDRYECFSILRPTSPFRLPATIRRAWSCFRDASDVDSLRAVELCRQHPGKMWVLDGARMAPLLESPRGVPWHSTPYQALPPIYVQNASLEIAWVRVVFEEGTIAGGAIAPFLTEGLEGFDINDADDWLVAEARVRDEPNLLPVVEESPYAQKETSIRTMMER